MTDLPPPREADANLEQKITGTASELNNLLQIISGTAELIENIWHGSSAGDRYVAMLRQSVVRAATLTSQLINHASGVDPKILIHPAARDRMSGMVPCPPRPSVEREEAASILVVDDEPMALELAAAVLGEAGFKVVTAENGFECLGIFSSNRGSFSLVVLDLSMPFMDGEETFDRLLSIDPATPVLLSTGYIHPAKLETLFARGLAGLVTKPYPPTEFVERVRTLIDTPRTCGTASA